MPKKIKFDDTAKYVEQQFQTLLRVAVLETDRRLKNESPVDTGRFRASWAIGENNSSFPGKPRGKYTNAPPNAINYKLGQERAGNVYSIHNNLPYAERLADGSSIQAPKGWIVSLSKDIQTWIDAQANRIGNSS